MTCEIHLYTVYIFLRFTFGNKIVNSFKERGLNKWKFSLQVQVVKFLLSRIFDCYACSKNFNKQWSLNNIKRYSLLLRYDFESSELLVSPDALFVPNLSVLITDMPVVNMKHILFNQNNMAFQSWRHSSTTKAQLIVFEVQHMCFVIKFWSTRICFFSIGPKLIDNLKMYRVSTFRIDN